MHTDMGVRARSGAGNSNGIGTVLNGDPRPIGRHGNSAESRRVCIPKVETVLSVDAAEVSDNDAGTARKIYSDDTRRR